MKHDSVTDLIEICLQLANIVEANEGYLTGEKYNSAIGLGYRAFTHRLWEGAKAVIDLRCNFYDALIAKKLAETGEEEVRDLLEDIFGDRDAESMSEEYKEKFRALLKELDGEASD